VFLTNQKPDRFGRWYGLTPRQTPFRLALMSDGRTRTKSVRFNVSDVEPSSERLASVDVKSNLDRTAEAKILVCPQAAKEVVRDADFHPLIAAAALAFKQHYPLVLSPDMIWLTVLQGVAQHIQNNAEALRTRLLHHQTKIELIVSTNLTSLPADEEQMLSVAKAFSDQIARHIPLDKRSLFQAEFSTTTDIERIAANVVLMEAFQPYFDYVFRVICGIPSVILEGTADDWALLSGKVLALHKSDLELAWWTKNLLPLCDHFERAARGDVDLNHWRDLCKVMERYGADDLNGWLLQFVPYVREDRNERSVNRNPVLEPKTREKKPVDPASPFRITGCTSDMLPSGISGVPVTCRNMQSGDDTEMQFLAGFTGVEQAPDDLSLRPVIGWAISESSAIDALIHRLRKDYGRTAPKPMDVNQLIHLFGGHLPGDMWRFYTEIDGLGLQFREMNQWEETGCQIFSLKLVKPLWDSRSVADELRHLSIQGEISSDLFEQRKEFSFEYGGLIRIASGSFPNRPSSYYVFGRVDDVSPGIYRWSGRRNPDAFTRVADSFTEWLKSLLDAASPSAPASS